MKHLLKVNYDGGDAGHGRMNAYDVADAIRGFSDFSRKVGDTLYGQEGSVSTQIVAIDRGSFEIELLYQFLGQDGAPIIASMIGAPIDYFKVVAECFDLIKHLKGEPPKKVIQSDNGGVAVENNQGTINNFNDCAVNIVINSGTGRSLQKLVNKPLSKGANKFKISVDDKNASSASKKEAAYFVPYDTSQTLTEHTYEAVLIIRTVILEGTAMWKFFDGRTTFSAPIQDETFLNRVRNGDERFGKGDQLFVRVRAIQKRVDKKLKSEYFIEEVISHDKGDGKSPELFD